MLPIAKYILNFRLYFTPFQLSFQHFPYGTNSLPVIPLYLALAVWSCYIQLRQTYPNLLLKARQLRLPRRGA